MIECHWNSFNTFEHYGSGGFDMKGWDALNTGTLPLFHFKEIDAERMREELLAPHFPYQPCMACRTQQQNYLI